MTGTGALLVDSSFAMERMRSDIMAMWRHAVDLAMSDEDVVHLTAIARSRTERASREASANAAVTARTRRFSRWGRELECIIRRSSAVLSGRWPMVCWRRSMTGRAPAKKAAKSKKPRK